MVWAKILKRETQCEWIMQCHSVTLSAFVKPQEPYDEIKNSLVDFVHLDFERERITIKEEKLDSADHDIITSLSLTFTKQRHVDHILETLRNALSTADKELLIKQYLTRIDEELNFFLRLDKESFLKQEYTLTDSGQCIHFKVHLACFPAKIERAKPILMEIFK